MAFHVPEKYRLKKGAMGSNSSFGNKGAFFVPYGNNEKSPLRVVASDYLGWEHCSVSRPRRCPTWQEMAFIKDLFWDGDDVVIQYHPAKKEYINCHPYTLHLWRRSTHTNSTYRARRAKDELDEFLKGSNIPEDE